MSSVLVVIDTNVIVAGLLTPDKSAPTAQILDGMLRRSFSYLRFVSHLLP